MLHIDANAIMYRETISALNNQGRKDLVAAIERVLLSYEKSKHRDDTK
jgi:hypothetical protein